MSKKPYQEAIDKLMAQLESGTVPWRKPWRTAGIPRNLVSQKAYRGMNVVTLLMANRPSPYWLTYNQALNLGSYIMKGEKGTLIYKYQPYEKKTGVLNEETGEEETLRRGFFRSYVVFNLAQAEPGLAQKLGLNPNPELIENLPAAQALWDGYPNPPALRESDSAWYRPSADLIGMPPKASFAEQREYYSTLFHEMVHSTGALKRLSRDSITQGDGFASKLYSEEELVAEFGASILGAMAGIQPQIVENNAAYIKHWLEVLKASDNKLMLQKAIGQAQKAADYILNASPKEESVPVAA